MAQYFTATLQDLEIALTEEITEWVSDILLPDPEANQPAPPLPQPQYPLLKPVQVVRGFIPTYYAGQELGTQDKAPVIAVRAVDVEYSSRSNAQIPGLATVAIMILTWNNDESRVGYRDVLNLINRITQNLLAKVKVKNFILSDDKIRAQEVVPEKDDWFPYWLGGITVKFIIPSASPAPIRYPRKIVQTIETNQDITL